MKYTFNKDGKDIAVLIMPDDVECFGVLGELMDKLGTQYVSLEKADKEKPLTEDEERSKRIWDMVNEMEAE